MQNPCSYDAVKNILTLLLNECQVPDNRKWTSIGCDGLPHILASRKIDDNENYQKILLQLGEGHYEMHIVKACFKIL